jgi:hypothetical protein
MKRLLPLNILWLCVALSAYFLGTQRFHPDASGTPSEMSYSLNGGGDGLPLSSRKGTATGGRANSSSENRGFGRPSMSGLANDLSVPELVKMATSHPSPIKRAYAFAELLDSLTPENVEEIVEAMREADDRGEEQWRGLLYAWGAMNGEAAIAYAEENMREDEEKQEFLSRALTGWASAQPSQAKAWVEGLEDENEKGRYRWSLVSGMADTDIATATLYAMERQEAGDTQSWRYMQMISEEQLRQSSVQQSVQWAESLPAGDLKASAMQRVAEGYVDKDPEGAAKWATNLIDGPYASKVIPEVSDEWAERDAPATIAWLETLEAGEAKTAGMSAALAEWVKRGDPMEASKYLAAMPKSEERDSAVGGFAQILARSDPEAAVTWAETIGNDKVRSETLVDAGRAWLRLDPATATDWLQGGDLDEAIVERIVTQERDEVDND